MLCGSTQSAHQRVYLLLLCACVCVFPNLTAELPPFFLFIFAFEKAATVSLDVVQRRVCVCACVDAGLWQIHHLNISSSSGCFFPPLFALCSLKQVSQWRQDTDQCCHCQRESCDEVVCFFCSATQFFSLPSSCVVIFQFSYTFTNNQNARFLKTDVMGLIIGSSTFCIDSSNNESFLYQFCPTPSFSLER